MYHQVTQFAYSWSNVVVEAVLNMGGLTAALTVNTTMDSSSFRLVDRDDANLLIYFVSKVWAAVYLNNCVAAQGRSHVVATAPVAPHSVSGSWYLSGDS